MFMRAPARAIGAGQNPCGVSWRVIVTEHFKVIYPAEIEADGQRVAATLEHIYPHVTKTLNFKPRRLPVLLYTRSTTSNGMALYMPRRTQWWNVPPQDSTAGTTDWYTDLAIHEFRHIVQFDSLNRGFNRALYVLFGETAAFAMGGLSVPWWFIEGDAVGTETALTSSGRGRLPEFDVELRALLLSGKRHKYFKALFGSYREWDPLKSPYLLGYYLTTHVKRTYGPEVWSDMMVRSGWLPFVPHWFSFMLISKTGSSAPSLYNDAMNEMEGLWRKQLAGLTITAARPLHGVTGRRWTYNNAPQYGAGGSVVTLRYGMDDIPTLVRIDPASGSEKKLCHPGQINQGFFSLAGDRAVWTEQVPDPRWGQQDYSVIVRYDITAGKKRFITEKSRLFSPALSPDGKKIAAVEFTTANRCSLVLIDADTGNETGRFPNPENELIVTPRWSLDGTRVTYCKNSRARGRCIALADPATGAEIIVVPYTAQNLYFPVSDGTYVYFVSPHSGIDNVYAAAIAGGKTYQVTSRAFGAYYPSLSPDGRKLAFNDVTADGYTAAEMDLDPARWVPMEMVADRSVRYHEPLIAQEAGGDITKNIPLRTYESKPYSVYANFFSVHSWTPMANPFSHELSLSAVSLNLLNTTELSAGYSYNWNEKTHAGFIDISYAGWYPVIDAGCFYGGRSSTYSVNYYYGLYRKTYRYSWRELSPVLGLRIPFNLTRSRFSTLLTIGVSGRYIHVYGMNLPSRYFTTTRNHNGPFVPLTYYASFFNGYNKFGDINPRWGQSLDASYTHTPFGGNYRGSILSVSGTLYFPGFWRNHSFWVQGGYERQTPNDYHFGSRMLFARGYAYEFSRTLWKAGINYTFPIYDPDWNLVHVIHFKRFYANAFGDYSMGGRINYRSAGLELYAEIFLFSIEVPFVLGVRGTYLFDYAGRYTRPYDFQFLFGIGMDLSTGERKPIRI